MWVRRSEWDKLQERVRNLEYRAEMDRAITVYDVNATSFLPMGYPVASEKIEVKDAIMRILAHLKLGLKYRRGQPSGVDFLPTDAPPPQPQRTEDK